MSVSRWVTALGAVIAAVAAGCASGVDLEEMGTVGSTTSRAPEIAATVTSSPMDTAAPPTVQEGWTFTEIPFVAREGSAYAVGGGWLFVWGGAPDRSGDLRSDGLLIDIATGEWIDVPDAPMEPRYAAASAWSGSEFVVVGGHSFDESFVDGAAFDPLTHAWREVADIPLRPAAFPSAVWIGDEFVVWLAGADSHFAGLPRPAEGQLAAYQPSTDTWQVLEAPGVAMVDAVLLESDGRLVLMGGPTMRDVGTVGSRIAVVVLIQDPDTGSWSDPVEGPVVEAGRAFRPSEGVVGVVTDLGTTHVLTETGWDVLGGLPKDCPFDTGAASGGGRVFLKYCSVYRLDGNTPSLILDRGDYGATGNLFGSGFLATADGTLVTFGANNPGGQSDTAVLGVFRKST